MFFSRNKSKTNRFYTFDARSVEAETIKRWKEIASQKYPADGSTESKDSAESWRVDDSQKLSVHRLEEESLPAPIQLTSEAIVDDDYQEESATQTAREGFGRVDYRVNYDDEGYYRPLSSSSPAAELEEATAAEEAWASEEQDLELNEDTDSEEEFCFSSTLTQSQQEQKSINREPDISLEAPKEELQSVKTCDFSLAPDEDIKRRFGLDVRSALGPGTVIEGTFRFDSPVCIDGTLSGEVSSSSALIVGEQAEVNAKIRVGSLIILGQVKGDIEAADLVEVRANGSLEGDVTAKRLVIEDGAIFTGTCNMS